jgi:hypothetical protein
MTHVLEWLFTEREQVNAPDVQARIDRDIELRSTRTTLLATLGREPTHGEIWNAAP